MSEWNKFSVNPPSDFVESLWVSDGKEVIACVRGSVLATNKCGTMTHWMVRVPPKPPEKEKHDCWKESNCGTFFCYETNEGELVLEHDGGIVEIKYCPHCGFTQEKKNE